MLGRGRDGVGWGGAGLGGLVGVAIAIAGEDHSVRNLVTRVNFEAFSVSFGSETEFRMVGRELLSRIVCDMNSSEVFVGRNRI